MILDHLGGPNIIMKALEEGDRRVRKEDLATEAEVELMQSWAEGFRSSLEAGQGKEQIVS